MAQTPADRARAYRARGHWFTLTVELAVGQDEDVARGIIDAAVTRLTDVHAGQITAVLVEGDAP